MKRRVISFFPHNPWPPRTGAHKRCLEILSGLEEIGCEVALLSSTLSSETKWERSSIETLNAHFVRDVHIYEGNILDWKFRRLIRAFYRLMKKNLPVNSSLYSPPGMRRWFERVYRKISPDIVIISYAYWDGLLNHRMRKSAVCVIDTLDLLTLNMRMREILQKYLSIPSSTNDKIDERILEEDYFEKKGLVTDKKEFLIYDKYDYTIAISPFEVGIIGENTRKTTVLFVPMTHEVCHICNSYSGPALFPTGPNPFNIQGYLYFVKKVLPRVRRQTPSFCLAVTGFICKYVAPEDGIVLRGFVPNLTSLYESSKFLVCPILGITGQQVKIVEAMAHGVPVIALRAAAEGSPIVHGINGLVANTAEEFADYVIQLWDNKEFCRRLGDAARNTIAAEFSRSHLLQGLSRIISAR